MFVSPEEFRVYSEHSLNMELSGTFLEITTPVSIIDYIKKETKKKNVFRINLHYNIEFIVHLSE